MIPRILAEYAAAIFTKYPVVTVTGPRQSGKTTLARDIFADKPYANLENPFTRQFAQEDPLAFLNQYPEGAVIDEIQRVPDLLSYIQVIVDERGKNSLFVLTGSQQFELMRGISQPLAGRTALLKLLPLSIPELFAGFSLDIDEMLFKGFYPRIYAQDLAPAQAYGDYFETYVERDLRQLVNVKDLSVFQRFVRLCAGRCGQLLNLNSLANDTGISQSTARLYVTCNVRAQDKSRTLTLGYEFLEEYLRWNPQDEVQVLDLYRDSIQRVDLDVLNALGRIEQGGDDILLLSEVERRKISRVWRLADSSPVVTSTSL